jgi:hypothetical protein
MFERRGNPALLFFTIFFFQAALAGDLDTERAKFTINYNGEGLPYEVMSVFVLPKETLVFELPDPPAENSEIKWGQRFPAVAEIAPASGEPPWTRETGLFC